MADNPIGPSLLLEVSRRFVARFFLTHGAEVRLGPEDEHLFPSGMTLASNGRVERVSVWSDPYFGTDETLAARRDLPFYRLRADALALPVPGPGFRPDPVPVIGATRVLAYHRIALPRTLDDIAALLRERDEIFFDEIDVEADSLITMDANEVAGWLSQGNLTYPTRPVSRGSASRWLSLVPVAQVFSAVSSARDRGSITDPE